MNAITVGRGEVIEGQVWSLRGASPPVEAEVLKTFSTWGKPHHEPVLMLRWSRDMPTSELASSILADVFQLQRQDLEADWELVVGPRTDVLRKAVRAVEEVTPAPNE